MKQKLFSLLFAIVASFGTMSAWDYEHVQIGDLYYNLDATNQTAEVTYEENSDNYSNLTSVNIPASVTYNNFTYSVTSIGDWAFNACSSLSSVTIPNSVTSIEMDAFARCSDLTSVTIGNSVTSIGSEAFLFCSSLTSVTIPNSVTSIAGDAFDGCSGLTSPIYNAHIFAFMPTSYPGAYTIPNGIMSINDGAFYRCSGLTSVTIPNSVTTIGEWAFMYCSSLKNVVFGTSLKAIGEYAFSECPIDTITCYSNRPPTVGENAFTMPYSTIVFVPAEYLTYYQMHDFWGLYDVRPIGESAGGETVSVTVNYQDKNGATLSNETFTFHFPEAPEVEGFTFLGWRPVPEIIDGSITIQAVYESTASSYSPASVSVPGNPAQRLIREGNVYILRDGKTYTATRMKVE